MHDAVCLVTGNACAGPGVWLGGDEIVPFDPSLGHAAPRTGSATAPGSNELLDVRAANHLPSEGPIRPRRFRTSRRYMSARGNAWSTGSTRTVMLHSQSPSSSTRPSDLRKLGRIAHLQRPRTLRWIGASDGRIVHEVTVASALLAAAAVPTSRYAPWKGLP